VKVSQKDLDIIGAEIEEVREKLNCLGISSQVVSDDLLKLSQKLDELINKYNALSEELKKYYG
jgi:uncharacterized coiled-coil DUF342 family protein